MSFALTRKTDYALLAMARLADEAPDAAGPLSARQIAQEYDLPLPVLMNVLKDLARAELVKAQRGAGGGYALTRDAADIRLAQVVAAIEGPIAVTLCCENDDEDDQCLGCRLTERCPITHTMKQFNDLIMHVLHSMTLADAMNRDVRFDLSITGRDGRTVAKPNGKLTQVTTPGRRHATA